ncbi:MAG: translocation/assembly module TamB domain-containing protein [bacterium]
MKKKIVLLLIIIGLGCLYLAWHKGLFYEPIKGQIVSQLEAETGAEVTIGDIGGGFFDHLILYRVRFVQSSPEGEASVISIDRVALRFSLWEIIRARGKWSPRWLNEIRLLRPKAELNLKETKPEVDWEQRWAAVINLTSFRVRVQKGELDLFDPVRNFSLPLRGIEAKIEPRHTGDRDQKSEVRGQKGAFRRVRINPQKGEELKDTTTLVLTATCSLGEATKPPQIKLWGRATLKDLNWKAEIDTVDLAALFRARIPEGSLPSATHPLPSLIANLQSVSGVIKGNLAGQVEPAAQELKLANCNGRLELKDGEVILGKPREKIKEGEVILRAQDEKITDVRGSFKISYALSPPATRHPQLAANLAFTARETPFKLQGVIFNSMEEIQLKAASEQVTWNKWMPAQVKDLDVVSPFSFEGSIKIKPSFLISGETALSSLSLNQGKTILPRLKANLRYQSNRLNLIRLKWGEGYLAQGELNWEGVPSGYLTLEAKNAPLWPLMKLSRLDLGQSTYLDGVLRIKGNPTAPEYEGNFILANLLEGKGRLAFKGEGKYLQLVSLKINQEKGRLEFEGGISAGQDQSRSGRLTILADQFRVGANRVSSQFDISGEFAPDVFAGHFKWGDSIINSTSLGGMEGRITYREGRWNLFTQKSENHLFIDGGLGFKGGLGLDLNLTLRGVRLDQAAGLLGLKAPGGGEVHGLVTVKRDRGKLSYGGEDLRIENLAGKYKGHLSLAGNEKGLTLASATLLLSEQSRLSFPGYIRLARPSTFSFKITASNLAGLNGQGRFEGQIDQGTVTGKLSGFEGDLKGLALSEGESSLNWAKDKKIVIGPSTLKIGQGGRLSTSGTGLTETAAIDFSLTGLTWPEAAVFFPQFETWKGDFSLDGRIAGGWLHPELTASLKGIQNGQRVKADFRWAANKIEIQSLHIDHSTAKGEIDLSSKPAKLKINLMLEGTSLSTLTALGWPEAPKAAGTVKGKIDVSGSISQPEVKGDISITDLITPAFSLQKAEGGFTFLNHHLSIPGFNLTQDEESTAIIQGEFDLASPGRVQFGAQTKEIEVARVTLGGKLSFMGESKGEEDISWTGKLKAEDLVINREYNFEKLTSEVVYHPGKGCYFSLVEGENGLSGQIDFSTDRIRIERLGLLRSGQKLIETKGWVDPSHQQLDLSLRMDEIDLGGLVGYIKLISKAEGKSSGWLRISGTFDDPELAGEMQVKEASFQTPVFKERIRQLEAELRIHDNALIIDSLKAMVGKSQLMVEGARGATPERLDFTIHNVKEPLPVLIPGFLEGEADINLKITGSLNRPVCARGSWIKLSETRFTYPLKPGSPAGSMGFVGKIRWEGLKVIAGKKVSYYNDYVDVEIEKEGYLEFIGQMAVDLDVVGQASARRGRFEYLGTEFRLKEAKMKFEEGEGFPYLTGTAEAEVGGERIILAYDGELFGAEPALTAPDSFPPKSRQEIVQLLRMGRDYQELGEADMEALLQIGLSRLVGQTLDASLINPLERQLSTALDIDIDIKLPMEEIFLPEEKKLMAQGEEKKKVEFNLGKYIAEDLYFTYRGIVKSQQERKGLGLGLRQEFELDYYLGQGESIKYQYRPEDQLDKEEHRIMLKKEFRF